MKSIFSSIHLLNTLEKRGLYKQADNFASVMIKVARSTIDIDANIDANLKNFAINDNYLKQFKEFPDTIIEILDTTPHYKYFATDVVNYIIKKYPAYANNPTLISVLDANNAGGSEIANVISQIKKSPDSNLAKWYRLNQNISFNDLTKAKKLFDSLENYENFKILLDVEPNLDLKRIIQFSEWQAKNPNKMLKEFIKEVPEIPTKNFLNLLQKYKTEAGTDPIENFLAKYRARVDLNGDPVAKEIIDKYKSNKTLNKQLINIDKKIANYGNKLSTKAVDAEALQAIKTIGSKFHLFTRLLPYVDLLVEIPGWASLVADVKKYGIDKIFEDTLLKQNFINRVLGIAAFAANFIPPPAGQAISVALFGINLIKANVFDRQEQSLSNLAKIKYDAANKFVENYLKGKTATDILKDPYFMQIGLFVQKQQSENRFVKEMADKFTKEIRQKFPDKPAASKTTIQPKNFAPAPSTAGRIPANTNQSK